MDVTILPLLKKNCTQDFIDLKGVIYINTCMHKSIYAAERGVTVGVTSRTKFRENRWPWWVPLV